MDHDVVIRTLMECDKNSTLGWQGGEPTLAGLDFYKRVMEYCPDHINHTMMTNGTLIDEDWAKFLKDNDFLVGISIDGTETIHNTYRDQWKQTIRGLQLLLDHGVPVNAVVTVNQANWNHGVRVYRLLVKLGITYLQFIPICINNNLQYPGGINGHKWGSFLVDVFREWLKTGMDKVRVHIFDECVRGVIGEAANTCVHSSSCGGFVVEANGDVYACEHFVDDTDINTKLGNILSTSFQKMANITKFLSFQTYKITDECAGCEYYRLCYGGCIKHRYNRFSRNVLCEGYQKFFKEFISEIVPLR